MQAMMLLVVFSVLTDASSKRVTKEIEDNLSALKAVKRNDMSTLTYELQRNLTMVEKMEKMNKRRLELLDEDLSNNTALQAEWIALLDARNKAVEMDHEKSADDKDYKTSDVEPKKQIYCICAFRSGEIPQPL